ncbi:MAG: DUF4404 family protein [Methylococcaceae bacterium]|nr:DUF4404 family protein [Methylococcaceae bacterium]
MQTIMTEQNINDALQQLRNEIDKLHLDDRGVKDRLNQLVESIEGSLGGEPLESDHDLVEELKDVISQFEVEHPRITGIVNELMMTLSNLGI